MECLNKSKIAYFSSLSLLLSYAELLLPRFIPFLKIGLANTIILLAMDFNLSDFIVLLIFKSVSASFISGTLFSPFFLISIFQSICSGLLMYFIKKFFFRFFSVYGISIAGAGISALVQIFLASLYLGNQVYSVLWIMLIFSIFSGTLTAFVSKKVKVNEKSLLLYENCLHNNTKEDKNNNLLSIISIILTTIIAFLTKNLIILSIMLITALIFQLFHKRKIIILPYIYLWIFVIIMNLLTGEGRLIYKAGFISIYDNSLYEGISKALKLTVIMVISQGAARLSFNSDSMLSLILMYFSILTESFNSMKGGIIERLRVIFNQDFKFLSKSYTVKKINSKFLFEIELLIFLLLFFFDFYVRKFK